MKKEKKRRKKFGKEKEYVYLRFGRQDHGFGY